MRRCFLWLFQHMSMTAIFNDRCFVIFQSLFENRNAGNIEDPILISPKN